MERNTENNHLKKTIRIKFLFFKWEYVLIVSFKSLHEDLQMLDSYDID